MDLKDFVIITVSGRQKVFSKERWDSLLGPKPDLDEFVTSNGCTASPDYLHNKAIWPACVIHDYHYSAGGNVSRARADYLLGRNIYKLLRWQKLPAWRAVFLATAYFVGVRRAGNSFYSGNIND